MHLSRPAARLLALTVAATALVAAGAAYAASGAATTRIDSPATASLSATRVTTTIASSTSSTVPPGPVTTMPAGAWTTRGGPGTMLFPLDPRPTCGMHDNFGDSRGGRSHEGTDIQASLGREVYAVEDGRLYRQSVDGQPGSELSGNGWTLRGASGATYAFLHLSAFAPGLQIGSTVVKGQVIGYVGDTGNPGPGNYHLHFEVHPGGGAAVDPYPMLDIPTLCTG